MTMADPDKRPAVAHHTVVHAEATVSASAERDIQSQLKDAGTFEFVDPLLAELEQALNTDERSHDPIADGTSEIRRLCVTAIEEQGLDQLIHEEAGLDPHLSLKAIVRTDDEVLQSDTPDAGTQLGPEDVRWLKLLRAIEVQDQQQE